MTTPTESKYKPASSAPADIPILVWSSEDNCWVAATKVVWGDGEVWFSPIPVSYDSDNIVGVEIYMDMPAGPDSEG